MSAVFATIHYHDPAEPNPVILLDADGVPGRRIDAPLVTRRVPLTDARTPDGAMSFEVDGVSFVSCSSAAAGLETSEARDAYARDLETLLRDELGALEVVVFDHTERFDGPGTRPPARHAHGDYTSTSARRRLDAVLGEQRAAQWAAGAYGIVNVWRPLGAVVERAPLAFARPSSVEARDWIEIELVYPDRRGQISGLLPGRGHQWVYLSRMRPDEAAVFRVFDSRSRPPVAHTAVDLEDAPAAAPSRRSIESRVMVRYG